MQKHTRKGAIRFFLLPICFLLSGFGLASGQSKGQQLADSLLLAVQNYPVKTDSVDLKWLVLLGKLCSQYRQISNHTASLHYADSIMSYCLLYLPLSKDSITTKLKLQMAWGNNMKGNGHLFYNDYAKARGYYQKSLTLYEEIGNKIGVASTYTNFGLVNYYAEEYDEALKNFKKAFEIQEQDKNREGMARSINNIALIESVRGNYKGAIKNYMDALPIAKDLNNQEMVSTIYSNIAIQQQKIGNYSEALANHFSALEIQKEVQNKQGMANTYYSIGFVYRNRGNYPKALQHFLLANRMENEIGNKRGLSRTFNGIATIYFDQKKYQEALDTYSEALKIDRELGDKEQSAESYANIGECYRKMNRPEDAFQNYSRTLELFQSLNDTAGIGSAYKHFAGLAFSQGNYKEAERYYLLAVPIEEKREDKERLASSFLNLGEVYSMMEQYDKSGTWLDKALLMYKSLESTDGIRLCYKNLADLNEKQKKFEEALRFHKLVAGLQDSLFNDKSQNEMNDMMADYETDKKVTELNHQKAISEEKLKQQELLSIQHKQEILLGQKEYVILRNNNELQHLQFLNTESDLQEQKILFEKSESEKKRQEAMVLLLNKEKAIKDQELQRQRLIRNIIIAGILLAGVIGFLIFNRFQLRKKIESQQAIIEERIRISRELHDDVGAQLSTAKLFLNDLKKNFSQENGKELLDNSLGLLETSIKDLRTVMEELRQSTLKDQGYIAATEELVNKINQQNRIRFRMTHHGVDTRLPEKTEHNLYRITQELINNTMKYAEAKNVTIDLVRQPEKVVFTYEDDGKGFDIASSRKGYGLSNIESRIKALDGYVETNTSPGNGFMTLIEIPVAT